MKTFKQFSEQAYTSYELVENPVDYLKGKVTNKIQSLKDYPTTLRSAASAIKKDPVGSARRGVGGFGKWWVKDELLEPVTKPLKRVTGNNPVTNTAIDSVSQAVATVPWRQTIRGMANKGSQVARTHGPKLAKTFGQNLLRGPKTALTVGSTILSALGIGSGVPRI